MNDALDRGPETPDFNQNQDKDSGDQGSQTRIIDLTERFGDDEPSSDKREHESAESSEPKLKSAAGDPEPSFSELLQQSPAK